MSRLAGVIRELRELQGWRQKDMAEKLGITQGSYSQKERGAIRFTPKDRVALAKIFGLSLEELDERWKSEVIPLRPNRRPGIPVINKTAAGTVVDYEEWGVDSGDGFEFIESGRIRDELAFAVVVVGDSMSPTLEQGNIAVFSPFKGIKSPPRPLVTGDICFIRFLPKANKGKCAIARYQGTVNDQIIFTKDNAKQEPMHASPDDIDQLAIAVERRIKL